MEFIPHLDDARGGGVLPLRVIKNENSWVARYGGEEFLLGGQHSRKEEAVEFAETLRKTIESSVFTYEDIDLNETIEIKITSSFGVCSISDIKDPSPCSLISCADRNLYRAKENGRNRVEF